MQEFIPAIGVCAVAGNLVLGMIDDQGTKWKRGIVDEYMIQGQTHVAFVYLWLLLQITARINAAVQSRNGGCCTQNGRRKREQSFGDLHVGSRMEKRREDNDRDNSQWAELSSVTSVCVIVNKSGNLLLAGNPAVPVQSLSPARLKRAIWSKTFIRIHIKWNASMPFVSSLQPAQQIFIRYCLEAHFSTHSCFPLHLLQPPPVPALQHSS